jgi:copper(I)-binding protein
MHPMRPSLAAPLLGLLIVLVSPPTMTDDAPAVTVTDAYARAVPPGQPNGAVYLTLTNHSAQPRTLVAATSPNAQAVELHSHIHEADMMRMRRVERIEIPAGGSVSLEPGGLHLMLIGLKGDLQPGDQVGLTLDFDDGSKLQVPAPVRPIEPSTVAH